MGLAPTGIVKEEEGMLDFDKRKDTNPIDWGEIAIAIAAVAGAAVVFILFWV